MTGGLERRCKLAGLVAASLVHAACAPDFGDRLSILDAPRILAIGASPAEQKPAGEVTFDLLFASPDGAAPPTFDWAFCDERKPLSASGSVSPSCLRATGSALVPLGEGESATGQVPDDACRVFGPDPPVSTDGEPAGRAADPDASGGYYQPVRVRFEQDGEDVYVTGAVRVTCGLPGATPEQAVEMTKRSRRNERPVPRSLALVRAGAEVPVSPDDGATPPVEIAPGEAIVWRTSWDACPSASSCGDGVCGIDEDIAGCADDCTAPTGCAGAEQYVFFDPASREVRERREAIQVSWFATAGAFAHDRTGRGEEEADLPSTENPWTAPDEEGDVTLWTVIRDDRGGVGWQRYRVRVARRGAGAP